MTARTAEVVIDRRALVSLAREAAETPSDLRERYHPELRKDTVRFVRLRFDDIDAQEEGMR